MHLLEYETVDYVLKGSHLLTTSDLRLVNAQSVTKPLIISTYPSFLVTVISRSQYIAYTFVKSDRFPLQYWPIVTVIEKSAMVDVLFDDLRSWAASFTTSGVSVA